MAGSSRKETDVVAHAVNRRWCVYHHGEVDATKGSFIQLKSGPKWMCSSCQENRAKAMKNRR